MLATDARHDDLPCTGKQKAILFKSSVGSWRPEMSRVKTHMCIWAEAGVPRVGKAFNFLLALVSLTHRYTRKGQALNVKGEPRSPHLWRAGDCSLPSRVHTPRLLA